MKNKQYVDDFFVVAKKPDRQVVDTLNIFIKSLAFIYYTFGTKRISIEKVLPVIHGLYIKLRYIWNKADIHREGITSHTWTLY